MLEIALIAALVAYTLHTLTKVSEWLALRVWPFLVENRLLKRKLYAIAIHDHGDHKINVIKCIRNHLGMGLKEAKEASEGFPSRWLVQGWDSERAALFAAALRAEGADVGVVPMSRVPT